VSANSTMTARRKNYCRQESLFRQIKMRYNL
jgi:hypothetical protein